MAVEWVTMAYLLLTLVIVLFAYTRVENPQAMIWGRVRIAAMTVALWGAYRLVPCRLTRCVRIVTQLALLGWWYPDTYEINRMFPNLDHVFAVAEQQLFGCQPAVYFAQTFSSNVVSELMSMGYASYYPMILVVVLFYFFCRYTEFERCALVVLASFFLYYVIYIFVPVAGPTFYYKAVGMQNILTGVFPNIHDYFNTHTDCLTTPGYADGFFYHMVEGQKRQANVLQQPSHRRTWASAPCACCWLGIAGQNVCFGSSCHSTYCCASAPYIFRPTTLSMP